MDLREKYRIERIIEKVVTENKDKTLNEIKRMVKNELRQEEERKILEKGISWKVSIDDIIEVITAKELLGSNQEDKVIAVREESKKDRNKEKER